MGFVAVVLDSCLHFQPVARRNTQGSNGTSWQFESVLASKRLTLP